MTERINKDMIIADMLKIDAGIAAILMASGMHCIGCPSGRKSFRSCHGTRS